MFLMYPDSMPENWKQILTDTGVAFAISPLHDKDKWTKADEKENPQHKEGTPKKPHYHVLVSYPNNTTIGPIDEIRAMVNGTEAKRVFAAIGQYRYHLHMDNPEKAQYDHSDRTILNGFDDKNLGGKSLSEREINRLKLDLKEICKQFVITSYIDLIDILESEDGTEELIDIALNNSIFINAICDSVFHKVSRVAQKTDEAFESAISQLREKNITDEKTGEVKHISDIINK